ncbi:hypothetical protein PPYR_03751 [Photinus pyralis]|uniref:Geranylgeranyl transferase type-1 subunit beta n=1 Tax=Photinus pyralis TaxID=7054 RepID=A0A1Y1KZU9_PHOPY|nr:geranylgeranyl transferase type-1 subunit beta isoform X2 [Photinus pyralis]KAB0801565.1 hypothetical protein PPYR_03751 [Photinus pyralis]
MNIDPENKCVLNRKVHIKYLLRFLEGLPSEFTSCDTTRITIAYFIISSLDILNSLNLVDAERRNHIIEWIYSLQVVNDEDLVSGFQGSSTVNTLFNRNSNSLYKWSHLAGTYCGLCSLIILGDDLSKVNRGAIIKSLKSLQLTDGCFTGAKSGTENDMRFLFMAASICYILNDWSAIDATKAIGFIKNSISYDYGIGQGPELESHGGSSYCAVATLCLINKLNVLSTMQIEGLRRWLLNRQVTGFQGRPNKPIDTCYSFWVGAALKMLNAFQYSNYEDNRGFILATQNNIVGGFSKWVNTHSDPLHTYLGLAGLSLIGEKGLNDIVPSLNITYRALEHLRHIQLQWT